MKLSALFSLAAATLAAAVALPDGAPPPANCSPDPAHPFPSCATPCMAPAIASVGCGGMNDYICQCKNFDKLHDLAADCVAKACGAQASELEAAAMALCMACH